MPGTPLDLRLLGWDDRWAEAFAPHAARGLLPARVAVEYNHLYRVYAPCGELRVRHAGRLLHRAGGRDALAAVGDWVAVAPAGGAGVGTIEAVLPRRSRFSRKVAGDRAAEQVVAANVDVVFLVMGLDRDFNPRRLERYLVLAHESGARPVVLLTKADLVSDVPARVAEARAAAAGVDVAALNAPAGVGLEAVRAHLAPGRTAALLGSSGAGKSTIVNALAGAPIAKTQAVRPRDARGRHTTRHRQMLVLPELGVIIDTPGMRELQLWDVGRALVDTFDDIDRLSAGCRFADCRHRAEPGCAVVGAVQDGRLAVGRLESFRKLQEEVAAVEARRAARARRGRRARHVPAAEGAEGA